MWPSDLGALPDARSRPTTASPRRACVRARARACTPRALVFWTRRVCVRVRVCTVHASAAGRVCGPLRPRGGRDRASCTSRTSVSSWADWTATELRPTDRVAGRIANDLVATAPRLACYLRRRVDENKWKKSCKVATRNIIGSPHPRSHDPQHAASPFPYLNWGRIWLPQPGRTIFWRGVGAAGGGVRRVKV